MRLYGKKKKSIPTKVIIKVSLECQNFPTSFKIYGPYERTVECFKHFEDEITPTKKYDIFGVLTDFDRVLRNVVTETSMAMKVNRLSLNYEKVSLDLGYAPDFIEFDAMANKIVEERIKECVPEYDIHQPAGGEDIASKQDIRWFRTAA